MDFDAGEEDEDEQEVEEESNGRRGSIGGRSDGYSTDPGGNLASDYSDDEDMDVKVILHSKLAAQSFFPCSPYRVGPFADTGSQSKSDVRHAEWAHIPNTPWKRCFGNISSKWIVIRR